MVLLIFKIASEGTNKATYPMITSEGMQAGEAAAEQIAVEQATAESSEKEPLWKRIGKGALKAAAGIAIGVAVVVAAPVIAAASTAVAIAGCIIAAGLFLIGASLFCEGVNDIAFGVQGYDEEERPPTDGVLGLTGQRMELMEGCVTLAMLVLTGAELYYATAGILGYGTYLLNERLSKLPNIWPTSLYGITGFNSFGTATMGRVWDWTSVPAIPYTLAPAVPSIALLSNAQVVNMIEDGIAKMSGGGGSGGSGGNVPPEGAGKRNIIDNMDEIADDIVNINKKYSDGNQGYNSVESILNSASYYDDPYEQVAAVTRGVAGHAFENGNKRTALDTLNMLLDDFGLNNFLTETQKWDLMYDIAEGRLNDIAEIANVLKGNGF